MNINEVNFHIYIEDHPKSLSYKSKSMKGFLFVILSQPLGMSVLVSQSLRSFCENFVSITHVSHTCHTSHVSHATHTTHVSYATQVYHAVTFP